MIFTWLLSPRQRNIKKNSTAHNCEAGIFAIACGYTTNNSPGPEIEALMLVNTYIYCEYVTSTTSVVIFVSYTHCLR